MVRRSGLRASSCLKNCKTTCGGKSVLSLIKEMALIAPVFKKMLISCFNHSGVNTVASAESKK
jgi:hypothetical protein